MKFDKAIDHEVFIRASANNGFIVEVGCARFVYQSKEELLDDLRDYLANPKEMEKKFNAVFGEGPQQVPDETE